MRCLAALAILVLALMPSARAQDLVSGLSQDQIQITSNYAGTSIVVFGAIESPDTSAAPASHDVVVAVRGPDADFAVRRKARIAGIWINRNEITLHGMPGYYYVASTRPLNQIASRETLARYQLGLDDLAQKSASTRSPKKAEPFRKAAIRLRQRQHLYGLAAEGVEFLSYSLFRVRVPVLASAPRGEYNAEVYLFRDGSVVSAQTTPFFVDQIGLERRLFNFAHEWPVLYGFATVLMAALLGWASSFIFRQRA
jgi:uncharacterized protein (TIGR02186 family)